MINLRQTNNNNKNIAGWLKPTKSMVSMPLSSINKFQPEWVFEFVSVTLVSLKN